MPEPAGGARPLTVGLIGTGAIEIPPPGYGAVEEYIDALRSGLGSLGHSATVLNRRPPFASVPAREAVSAALLRFDLRGRHFDLLHAHSPITSEGLLLSGRPFVLTLHSRYWLTAVRGRDQIWKLRDRFAIERARAVVALSPRLVQPFQALRTSSSPRLVQHIPFGVDIERFHPAAGVAPRSGIVGLGVVVAHKRFDIFAAAASRAGVPGRLIGRGADPAAVAAVRALNPDIKLLGEVPREELPDALGRAKIFVHPSDMELASVATVQAMACGLPVVGSDLLSDLVEEGREGFLIDHRLSFEDRVRLTADRIAKLDGDEALQRAMGERARARAVDEHGWPTVTRKMVELYRTALELN